MNADTLLAHLLLDLAVIVLAAQLLRVVLGKLRQPKALAEVLAGLALGPSLLGRLPGDPSTALFPHDVRPSLTLIGALGLSMFAFALGLQLDLDALRRRSRDVVRVSVGALVLPFAVGVALALMLYGPHHIVHGHSVAALPFTLFVATAMSITAFPVLASILAERGIRRTPLGELALSSAALQDGVGWLLLAAALSTLSLSGHHDVRVVLLETIVFLGGLFGVARPLLRKFMATRASAHRGEVETLAIAATVAMVSAGITQLIGVHEVVGAFAAGVAFPRDPDHRRQHAIAGAIMPLTLAMLLPVYFVTPGLQVNIGAIGSQGVAELALITLAACATKLIGAAVPARLGGMSWSEAGPLAVLLNTRGLMELVVLTVGYTEGVLDQRLFSVMVLMALATTMMTCPLLDFLARRGMAATRDSGEAAGNFVLAQTSSVQS